MVGVGVIGAGGIARSHAEALRMLGDRARIAVVADTDAVRAAAFAKEFGAPRAISDWRAALADPAVGMLCVCTPNDTHPAIVVAALEAGKAVLCEKPIAGSLAELDAIAEAERRTGGIVSSVFGWRYGGGYRAVRELVDRGLAGRVLWAQSDTLWRRTGAYYGSWRGTWQGERAGPLITLAIHSIDALFSLLPEPREVFARVERFTHEVEVEDTSAAVVRLDGNGMVTINCTSSNQIDVSQVRLVSERLYASSGLRPYTAGEWPWTLASEDTTVREAIAEIESRPRPPMEEPAHLSQIRDFLDHLDRGEAGPVRVAEARRSLEVIAGIYASAFTGRPVALPIAPDDPFYRAMNGGRELRGVWKR